MIPSFLVPMMGGDDVSHYFLHSPLFLNPKTITVCFAESDFEIDVPLIDQGDKVRVVQTLLFLQGVNTLLQTLFGTRLPTVIGGSYAFMVPIISIIHDSSLTRIEDPQLVCFVCLPFTLTSIMKILTPFEFESESNRDF